MRLIQESFLIFLPATAVGALLLGWPITDNPMVANTSSYQWLVMMQGACTLLAIATMVLAFLGLRRPHMRKPARGSALLLFVLCVFLSMDIRRSAEPEFGWAGIIAAFAAAATFWALLEISIEELHSTKDKLGVEEQRDIAHTLPEKKGDTNEGDGVANVPQDDEYPASL